MLEPRIHIDRAQLFRLNRTMELGEEFEEKFANLMFFVAGAIRASAQNASRAISSRVSEGIDVEMDTRADGEVIASIGSRFQGYPTYASDDVGSAGEAQRRGWGTLAHRFHYGYSGANPRAGFTAPTPFLIPFFEHWSKDFYETVSGRMLRQVLRGY